MSFCSLVSQLLVASSPFPHQGQDRGATGAFPTQPLSPERDLAGTWWQRGAQHLSAPHSCTFQVWNWSLAGPTWAKQTHTSLCHHPPTERVWEGTKHHLIQLFAALHRQKSLLVLLQCLCLWLGFPAKADCLVRILRQSLQVTSYPCGQKPSFLIMRDEMSQYCQNKKSWGIIDCHQSLKIFSWCKYPSITVSFMTTAIPSMSQRRME